MKFTIKMIDQEIIKLFAYSSISYEHNLKSETEEAIPPYWQVVNPGDAKDSGSDEGLSVFKQITPETITLTSNPIAGKDSDIGTIL